MSPTHPKGIRPWKGGWQAYVRVQGHLYTKQYPKDTALEVMKAWRLVQQLPPAPVPEPPPAPVVAGLAHDIAAYLPRVSAMPTHAQTVRHLLTWVRVLGADRDRAEITPEELEATYQTWLQAGLSPGEVRKRRSVLSAFYTRLEGRGGRNPAKASRAPRADRPVIRDLPPLTAMRILDGMRESKTKARLEVIAWTGLPPSILSKIQPQDLDLDAQTVRVQPRQKGSGAPARTLSLLPQAVDAFRRFHQLDAYGPFSVDAANTNFKLAAKRLTPPIVGIRLYDLRHGFATMLYRATHDLATTARFLLHSTTKITERYAAGAAADVDRAAVAKVGELLSRKLS